MNRLHGVERLRAMSDGFADFDRAMGWQRGTSLLWALNTLVPGWDDTGCNQTPEFLRQT
jgi:hypothetical protein